MTRLQENDRFRVRKAAAVVCPVDGYTGQPVSEALLGGMVIRMADGEVPVKKAGGYWVFWENGERVRTLIAESPWFEREELELDMEEWGRQPELVLKLWLMPGTGYPYPAEE